MIVDRLLNYASLVLWGILILYVSLTLIYVVPRQGLIYAIRRVFSRIFFLVLVLLLSLSIVSESLVFIEPQDVGVVISLLAPDGYIDHPLRSGLHWIAPVLENVYRYPVSWQTYTMSSKPSEGQTFGNDAVVARSLDGQEVSIDCSIIFRIDVEQVIRVHIDWQDRYINDFIRPTIRSTIRNLVSQYTAEEINSFKRTSLEQDLDEILGSELADKGFALDTFLLRNISFTPEYADAIERKQVAQQDVIQKQYEATQIAVIAEADASATTTRAKAEAEALKTIALALNDNPLLVMYRYVEKIAPNISVMLLPSDAPFILPIPTLQPAVVSTSTESSVETNTYTMTPTPVPTTHPKSKR